MRAVEAIDNFLLLLEKESYNYNSKSTPWRNSFIMDDERIHGLPDRGFKSGERIERKVYFQTGTDAKSGWRKLLGRNNHAPC